MNNCSQRSNREKTLRLLILLLATTVLAGCGAGFSTIRGKDNNVFFPAVRVSYPLIDRDSRHGLSDHAFELDVSQGRGSDRQAINAGETLSLGGTTFTGPADIQQVFNLDAASAAFRFRSPHEKGPIFIEFLGGVLYTDLGLRLRTGGFSAEQHFHDGGTIVGTGAGARVSDEFILALRYVADILPFNRDRFRTMKSLDFTASYWLSRHVALTGGYRRWKYRINRDNASDIENLVWQGFAAGVAYSF